LLIVLVYILHSENTSMIIPRKISKKIQVF
jgi:hypothetical protein